MSAERQFPETDQRRSRPTSDRNAITHALRVAETAVYYGHPPQAALVRVAAILSRATTVAGPIYRKAPR